MEKCVIESQIMYDSTPKSVSYRRYVNKEIQSEGEDPLDIFDLNFKTIENETSPRISTNDLVKLLKTPNMVSIIDLRTNLEFSRIRVEGSINIPFASIALDNTSLESLNLLDLDTDLEGKFIVIVSSIIDNAVLVSNY